MYDIRMLLLILIFLFVCKFNCESIQWKLHNVKTQCSRNVEQVYINVTDFHQMPKSMLELLIKSDIVFIDLDETIGKREIFTGTSLWSTIRKQHNININYTTISPI